ncbi:MAG: hypothetical protein D6730_18795 [Bacteroidetes bacterium]|nr:MAG: hypothetical protein D6730_18795 [Bacteroidota bacterium]
MKQQLLNMAHRVDAFFARQSLRVYPERPVLLVMLFHELFENQAEMDQACMFPHEGLTVEHFRAFVAYFLEAGYEFVSPAQVLSDLGGRGRYVLISFDDGYYNNHRALKVLREYAVPAVFSIATSYVLQQQAFWWDVHYRQERRRGKSFARILAEQQALKQLTFAQVHARMRQAYGQAACSPQSDTDRPFTAGELRDFAREKYVHLGNHTRHHAILPHYDAASQLAEIQGAQDDLEAIAGLRPAFIAYPNGEGHAQTARIARQAGLKLGAIATMGKQHLPLGPDQLMLLDRSQIFGTRDIRRQCDALRAEVTLKGLYRRLRHPAR